MSDHRAIAHYIIHVVGHVNVLQVQTLLEGLAPQTRQQLIKHRSKRGMTALRRAASRDRVEVAKELIKSADSEDREFVINCVDDDNRTPLYWAKSSAMVQTLLEGLTPQTRQQLIKHTDRAGQTAAEAALITHRELFNIIWTQSDLFTKLSLLQSTSDDGTSLLM